MSVSQPMRGLVNTSRSAMVPRQDIPRSQFKFREVVTQTFDAGYLVPFLTTEVLPGDHFKFSVSAFIRMATPLFPIFDSQTIDTFFFFVPNRLVWPDWVKFMGELDAGTLVFTGSMPTVKSTLNGGFAPNSLPDYFGLPTLPASAGGTPTPLAVQALPWRMYYLIYNEWFRDQNLTTKLTYNLGDVQQDEGDFQLQRRAKYHDYFTSALPFPFKGNQAGGIPLFGSLPVSGIGFGAGGVTGPTGTLRESSGANTAYTWYSIETQQPTYFKFSGSTGGYPQIFADLTSSGFMKIEDFRRAMAVQVMYERDARGGTRYTESLFQHFGVRNPDYRLQRPEYIGGGSSPMTITPVAQTAVSGGTTVGALGAASTGVGSHHASYASTEHGWILGLINIQTQLSYQQGIHKQWTRQFRTDYYVPALADLGEQAVLRREIYANGDFTNDNTVFGYQERWAEYRYRESRVAGKFRSNQTGSLDGWHLAEYFATAPVLGNTFISSKPPMARVLAAGDATLLQQYLANILIDTEVTRAMPLHSVPAQLGRF